jgi:hypothetical protein
MIIQNHQGLQIYHEHFPRSYFDFVPLHQKCHPQQFLIGSMEFSYHYLFQKDPPHVQIQAILDFPNTQKLLLQVDRVYVCFD